MKFPKAIFSFIIVFCFIGMIRVLATDITIENADTVWILDIATVPPDVIDSSDAPPQELSEALVSHADTVWNVNLAAWQPPPPPPPAKWSFAIITDLHIGRGHLNYDVTNYEDYYLTERLKKEVDYINANYKTQNIKFLAVLGDITDSGQYLEFKKAKEILDNLEVPYFPVIGNHDVWNWYAWQDEKSKIHKTDEIPIGDDYFNAIFNQEFYKQQFKKLGVDWWRLDDDEKLQNYAFSYEGTNFIFLDFIARNPIVIRKDIPVIGETATSSLQKWLDFAGDSSILLSHHPFAHMEKYGIDLSFSDGDLSSLKDEITGWEEVKASFSGHVHGYYDPYEPWSFGIKNPIFMDANAIYASPLNTPVVTTESSMVASNELNPKGAIRIVEMEDNKISNEGLIEGENLFSLNPYFKQIEWSPKFEGVEWGFPPKIKLDWKVEFELYAFNKFYPLSYSLDFGDGSSETIEVPDKLYPPEEIVHIYPKEGGTYNIELTAAKIAPSIEESITRTITIPRIKSGFFTLSPVDISLTDPDGLIVNKEISEIPGTFYFETDLDDDGELNDIIILPERKIGDYLIEVIPEDNATSTEIYTLGAFTENDDVIFLAQDIQISDIPEQPYAVRSDEARVRQIIPVTIDFDPDALNLKSKGQFVTAYIGLPAGQGYNLSMIDLPSVKLNNQIPAEIQPTKVGDYDKDGTSDLIVKFNRQDVQNIFQTGEKIKVTVNGNLDYGKLFEGDDFIRVTSP